MGFLMGLLQALGQGAQSLGQGLFQGVQSLGQGAQSLGQGLFQGVQSLGQGAQAIGKGADWLGKPTAFSGFGGDAPAAPPGGMNAALATGNTWMNDEPTFAQPQPVKQGLMERAQGAAEQLTSPLGAVRKGLFSFLPKTGDKTRGSSAPPVPMAQVAVPNAQSPDTTGINNMVLQKYQQMMQMIKQKRGY